MGGLNMLTYKVLLTICSHLKDTHAKEQMQTRTSHRCKRVMFDRIKLSLNCKSREHSYQAYASNVIMAAGVCSYTGCLFTGVFKHNSVVLFLYNEAEVLYFLIFLNTV